MVTPLFQNHVLAILPVAWILQPFADPAPNLSDHQHEDNFSDSLLESIWPAQLVNQYPFLILQIIASTTAIGSHGRDQTLTN